MTIYKVAVAFILTFPAFGQFGNANRLQGRKIDPVAPTDAQVLEWDAVSASWKPGSGGGPGSGGVFSTLAGIPDVVRTNSTTLTIGAQCVASPNCIVRFGNTAYALAAAVTAVITSTSAPGTARIYVASGGALTLGYDGNITMGTCTGITCTGSTTDFPIDSIPLYTWTAASNIWDLTGGTNWVSPVSTKNVTAGTGLIPTPSGGGTSLAVDATVIPQKFLGTAAPGSVAGNLPGDLFTDTTNHNQYVCNAPSGTAAPACTSVTAAGWLLVNSGGTVTASSVTTFSNKDFAQNVLPSVDSTYSLGSGSFFWANIYALTGNFYGVLAKSYQVNGQTFTASGCSNGTLVGGSTAGSFLSGTTGTCTVTITMGGSQTATNQWMCQAANTSTPANLVIMTASNTTTATLSGTTTSGDKIVWSCVGF